MALFWIFPPVSCEKPFQKPNCLSVTGPMVISLFHYTCGIPEKQPEKLVVVVLNVSRFVGISGKKNRESSR